jgi:hypothetical protein
MDMAHKDSNDRDEQAAWELIGRHESIEPSFGFAQRTLRRLEERPARQSWWHLPVVRWASSLGLAGIVAVAGAIRWQQAREAQRIDVYATAHQDSLDDYDVIAALDQLNGDNKL